MLGDDPDVRKHPIAADEQFSPRAEAFRQLRTNIRFLSVDRRLSSFVVTGSVEAEGKTTVAANLALALAHAGESVVLIDGDLRRPTLAGLFKLPGTVGLTNVLLGEMPLRDALQQWREDLPLLVLSSGPIPPNPSELLGSARLQEIIRTLTDSGWTVIFDSPPLLPVTDAAVIARATGGALLVTRVGSTRTDQLAASVEALHTVDAAVLGVVANRVPRRRGSASGYYNQQGYAPKRAPVTSGNQPAQTPIPPPRPPVERRNGHAPSPLPKKLPTATGRQAVPDAIPAPPGTPIPPLAPGTPVRPAPDS
jgi:capsular exopolysaccharide synthesis family protein